MKRLTRGVLAVTVALGATVAGTLPAAAAGKPVVTVEKGTSFDVDVKAGEGCSFATQLHGEADIKTIEYKHKTVTIYTHAFGRVTNPQNHKSVKLNANVKFVDRELDGTAVATTSTGNAIVWGSHVGFSEEAGPAFLYIQGKAKWINFDPNSAEAPAVFSTIKGKVTNVCTLID